jgi:TatD DNase family protein
MTIVDSHCHLTHKSLIGEVDEVLTRARDAGVGALVTVGCGREDAERAVALSERFEDVWSVVGVHPHDAGEFVESDLEWIERLAGRPRVVAIGEMGLDYHYDFSPRASQPPAFEAQLRLAHRLDMPVVIHCREAVNEALSLIGRLRDGGVSIRGEFHCFTGKPVEAEAIVAAGFHVGIAGIVTFKKSDGLREAALRVPADRLLIETDSPYLSPEPVRKIKRNEPAHVMHTLEFLADLRGVSAKELARQTDANVQELFGIRVEPTED